MLRFYRGVTSTLKFIKDILPNMKKYGKARKVILGLLSRMRPLVKSEEQELILNGSILEAEKLDQQKYGDITTALKDTIEAARANIEENERRIPDLYAAVSHFDRLNCKSRWTNEEYSSASILAATNVACLYFLYFITIYWNSDIIPI